MRLVDVSGLDSYMNDMLDSRNVFDHYDNGYSDAMDGVDDWLDEQPTLTLDDLRPRGQWVNNKDGYPECDQCGYMPQYDPMIDDIYYSLFCPSCGAKMDLEDANGQD